MATSTAAAAATATVATATAPAPGSVDKTKITLVKPPVKKTAQKGADAPSSVSSAPARPSTAKPLAPAIATQKPPSAAPAGKTSSIGSQSGAAAMKHVPPPPPPPIISDTDVHMQPSAIPCESPLASIDISTESQLPAEFIERVMAYDASIESSMPLLEPGTQMQAEGKTMDDVHFYPRHMPVAPHQPVHAPSFHHSSHAHSTHNAPVAAAAPSAAAAAVAASPASQSRGPHKISLAEQLKSYGFAVPVDPLPALTKLNFHTALVSATDRPMVEFARLLHGTPTHAESAEPAALSHAHSHHSRDPLGQLRPGYASMESLAHIDESAWLYTNDDSLAHPLFDLLYIFSGYNDAWAHRYKMSHGSSSSSSSSSSSTLASPRYATIPFVAVLPRPFVAEHQYILDEEPHTTNVKNHGQHFNILFKDGAMYVHGRSNSVKQVNLQLPSTALASLGSFVVDSERTIQDRGAYIDVVFHLFPIVMRAKERAIVKARQQHTGWIVNDQHAECTMLGKAIDDILVRFFRGHCYIPLATDAGKPVRLYIVAKEWFRSIGALRASVTGCVQLYTEDATFPYRYFHHPTMPWLSGPIDGIIMNFLTPVSHDVECRPYETLTSLITQSTRSIHGERLLPSSDVTVEQQYVPTQVLLEAQRYDRHFEYRVRIAKYKFVQTLDLRILGPVRNRSVLLPPTTFPLDDTEDPFRTALPGCTVMDVRYALACNNNVSDVQLRGVTSMPSAQSARSPTVHLFDQYLGMGVPASMEIARELWTCVVQQGRSLIVECVLQHGTYRIQHVRYEKTEPNHAHSVFPTLQCMDTTVMPR
jgi:hypothetical protein